MKIVRGNSIKGTLTVPGDKSISHRGLLLGAVSRGETVLENFLLADDTLATKTALESLGVPMTQKGRTITISGQDWQLTKSKHPLDLKNAGTGLRLLAGILVGQPFSSQLTGDRSLIKRPMKRIVDPLSQMGANITGDTPPLTILPVKSLQPIDYLMPIASAQVKSAIILAALQTPGKTTITEKIKSRNHTEEMVKQFGGDLTVEDQKITVVGGNKLSGTRVKIPNDFSAAAFFLCAASVIPQSQLVLPNVGLSKRRSGFLRILKQMNGLIEIEQNSDKLSGTLIVKASHLKGSHISGQLTVDALDELPLVALAATQAQGSTIVSGASELKHKESNRLHLVATTLNKMGAQITETSDGWQITGPTPLHGAEVDSYGDHRLAMMLFIAGKIATGITHLTNSEAATVSYPDFFSDFNRLEEKS
ncbi:3-phosphoshikimate 1-carboxyvinyltransferase [Enterococcus timonensis]|uniref:3-phosphoshikimate 1-carboxyvinyltransferase n=1 Tax=Enterococcus timonensis TaxID=1852364 RepID=UPI0008DB050F|nr:3-phosphoshikimate 1-carboxyvinyltransferase [Enterococcus timonensis]